MHFGSFLVRFGLLLARFGCFLTLKFARRFLNFQSVFDIFERFLTFFAVFGRFLEVFWMVWGLLDALKHTGVQVNGGTGV